jgi:cytochrome c oxidase cbb3-type subunit 3
MFYWLLTAILALIITIIILASTIINLAKSDYFRKKITEQSQKEKSGINTTLIAIIAFFGIMASNNQSLAFSFINPGETAEKSPWLLVEKMDLYYLIAIIGILILIVFYLKHMFNNLIEMIHPKVVEVIEEPQTLKKLNKVFNDIVPIEEEHTILMHHEYDGIRELDNNLPPWWLWMFFATIVFAFVYMFNFHVFKTGDLQIAEYEKDMKKSNKEVKAYLSEMSMNVDETSATLMTASDDLSQGKTLFETNCVTCHNPRGEGNIGPNLTDKFWLYGADIKEVFKTIKTGTPNGMPEHNSKFNPIQIQQVASFVLSLPEVKGKEAQGVEVK